MNTFNINGRKTYHVSTSIEAEDQEEAEFLFHQLELRDCDEIEEDNSWIDEITSDPIEGDGDEEI